MNDESAGSVLRRMIALSAKSDKAVDEGIPPEAAGVFGTTLARVAQDRFDMILAPQDVSVQQASLPELMELLPETGLLALVDGPGESQGVMALDADLFTAIVEQQTMGRLKAKAPPSRLPTRVDAALVADVIDTVLHGFGQSDAGYFVRGYGYTTFLTEARPLALMLEETDYAMISFGADLERGMRSGKGILAVPVSMGSDTGAAFEGRDAAENEWSSALRANLDDARVSIDAVLHRQKLPLSFLQKLAVGDIVKVPSKALNEVALVGSGGAQIGEAELGQRDGMRAIRIAAPETDPPPMGEAEASFAPSGPQTEVLSLEDTPSTPPALDMELMGVDDLPEIPAMPDMPDLPDLPSADLAGDLPDIGDLGGGDEGGSLPSLDDLPALDDLPDLSDLAPPEDGALPSLPSIEI